MDPVWLLFGLALLVIAAVATRQALPIVLERSRKGVGSRLGLEVGVVDQAVYRGDAAEAAVTIANSPAFEAVEAGLVCTEYYDVYVSDDTGGRTETREAIAYESWLPLENTPGEQSVRLAIPSDAPFSYEGKSLSFRWAVVARARRRRGLDPRAECKFQVFP